MASENKFSTPPSVSVQSGREFYVTAVENLIADHQAVQMSNPQSSEPWQRASEEIHRLAALIVEARR